MQLNLTLRSHAGFAAYKCPNVGGQNIFEPEIYSGHVELWILLEFPLKFFKCSFGVEVWLIPTPPLIINFQLMMCEGCKEEWHQWCPMIHVSFHYPPLAQALQKFGIRDFAKMMTLASIFSSQNNFRWKYLDVREGVQKKNVPFSSLLLLRGPATPP